MKNLFLTVVVASSLCASASALSFVNVTNNGNADLADQLVFELIDEGGSNVGFKFFNTSANPIDSYIGKVAIVDYTNFLLDFSSNGTIDDSASGVDFKKKSGEPNFSGLGTADIIFAKNGGSSNGIDDTTDGSEWVKFIFPILGGYQYSDVLSALGTGINVGLHLQSIDPGNLNPESDSEKYILQIKVPDSGTTFAFLGLSIAVLAYFRRKT